MAKLTAPIQEVSRLLDLVPFLSTHSHISLKELSKEFGVSEREMANELTALSMCGLPGYTPYELIEVFFDSGFVTINNHETLDLPRALTNIEATSLLLGLEILKDEVPEEDNRLHLTISELIDELRSLVQVPIDIIENPQSEFLPLINKAIASRATLQIEYLSPVNDSVKSRTVKPLEVTEDRGHRYLNSYCIESDGHRSFRIDRIVSVKLSEDQQEVSLPAEEVDPGDAQVQVKIYRSRRDFSETFQVENISTSGLASVEVFSESWLLSTARVFAPDLEIIAPIHLRNEMRESLEKILALYTP